MQSNLNNTYSQKKCKGNVGGDYDCRVDGTWDDITVKGWDRNKYGKTLDAAKHFCNTHKDCVAIASSDAESNWPVHTTSKFKPCNWENDGDLEDVTSGKPNFSVKSEEECNSPFPSATYTDKPSGCIKYGSNIRWNKHTNTNSCSSSTPCVQKTNNCDPKVNYHKKRECKKPIDGVWSKALGESCEWKCPGRSGVESYSVPKFKTTKNAYACSKRTYTYDKTKKAFSGGNRKLVPGRAYSCRSQSGGVFGWASYAKHSEHIDYLSSCSDWDNPAMFYKEVSNDEEPSLTVSEEECKAYADTHGYNYGVDQNRDFSSDKDPKGCFLNDKNVYFNKNTSTNEVCSSKKKCIQK